MSDINITHATEKDITEIVRIFLSSNNTDKSGAHWTESSAARYIEFWHNRSKPELQLIARLENGKIAGAFFADLKPLWDGNILWDGELFVCDKYQGKGIGAGLLAHMLENAKTHYGVTSFETFTFASQDGYPLSWYKGQGFQVIDDLVFIKREV